MNVLFVFYLPSGGMDAVNRHRCAALRNSGITAHCLYYRPGSGMQNATDVPTFITDDNMEIWRILTAGKYKAVIVTSDYVSLERFRSLGYRGKLILEIQGYGPHEVARRELTQAVPYVLQFCTALLHPKTPHIDAMLHELLPRVPTFKFNNAFDPKGFTYRVLPRWGVPIIAWVGRIDDNKNWREFLLIGHSLIHRFHVNVHLWMFEDHTLSDPIERMEFTAWVERLNLEPYLTIRSNVPHALMQEFYSIVGDSGGFLCLTSKVEGAPHSVVEAMSCRCPVISSEKDGVYSAIIHDQTGKFYYPGNISQAVAQGIELMGDRDLRKHIRKTAQKHLIRYFSLEHYADNFIKMMNAIRL